MPEAVLADAPAPSLDPAYPAALDRQRRSRTPRKPLPARALLGTAGAVVALLWGVWVTREVMTADSPRAPFAAVSLQPIVEEYVQAQARTSTPPEQVTRETKAFMAALDSELKARGSSGTTVLVAEAVLSKDVPDITADVRRAVYARVTAPGRAGAPSSFPALGAGTGNGGRN